MGAGILFSTTTAQAQLETGLLNYWRMNGTAADSASAVAGTSSTTVDNGRTNGSVTFADAATEGLGAGFGQVGNFPGGQGNNITVPDPSE